MYFMSVWDKKDRKDKKSLQENPGRRIRYRQALSQACCFSFSPETDHTVLSFLSFLSRGKRTIQLIYPTLFRVCPIGQKGQKGQNDIKGVSGAMTIYQLRNKLKKWKEMKMLRGVDKDYHDRSLLVLMGLDDIADNEEYYTRLLRRAERAANENIKRGEI